MGPTGLTGTKPSNENRMGLDQQKFKRINYLFLKNLLHGRLEFGFEV